VWKVKFPAFGKEKESIECDASNAYFAGDEATNFLCHQGNLHSKHAGRLPACFNFSFLKKQKIRTKDF